PSPLPKGSRPGTDRPLDSRHSPVRPFLGIAQRDGDVIEGDTGVVLLDDVILDTRLPRRIEDGLPIEPALAERHVDGSIAALGILDVYEADTVAVVAQHP